MNGYKIYSISIQQAGIRLYNIKIIHELSSNMMENHALALRKMPRAHFQSLCEMPRHFAKCLNHLGISRND